MEEMCMSLHHPSPSLSPSFSLSSSPFFSLPLSALSPPLLSPPLSASHRPLFFLPFIFPSPPWEK